MSSSKLPWDTLPRCPEYHIEEANVSGIIELVSGVKIWYAIFGVPLEESLRLGKAPLFFLHGGFAHSGYYGLQIDYFKSRYTVIVMDNRGHGRSPLGDKVAITYDDLADDVVGILNHHKISKVALIGWSDGATMAWSITARYPE